MKQLLICIVSILSIQNTFAQTAFNPTLAWATKIGSTTRHTISSAVAVDDNGNVYATGYTNPTTSGGAITFFTKKDKLGNDIWSRTLPAYTNANGIAVDKAGNVYIAGSFDASIDFDPGAGTYTLNASTVDIFLLKLNSSGDFVWARSMGGTSPDIATAIAVDTTGNIYVAGYFENTAYFGSMTVVSNGGRDIFVCKSDAAGNFLWLKNIGGNSTEYISSGLAVDNAGNVYISGGFTGTGDFDPDAALYPLMSVGSTDIFISKLNASGNFMWAKSMGSTGTDQATSIALDNSGNVYTTGYFVQTVDFDPGANIAELTSAGSNDIFVSKLDLSGNYLWARSAGGSGLDNGNTIEVDVSGDVYIGGRFVNTVDFDPDIAAFNLTSSGSWSSYLWKLNTAGGLVWAKMMGGDNSAEVKDLKLDPHKNLYVTGIFSGTVDFDPNSSVVNLKSATVAVYGDLTTTFIQKLIQCIVPAAPVASDKKICAGSTTSLIASGIGTIGWYTAAIGGTYLGNGSTYTTPALSVGTKVYYVQDSTCSFSPRTTVTVTIVTATVVTKQPSAVPVCESTATTLWITASNADEYQWQVNKGNEFENLSEEFPYSNTTKASLDITSTLLAQNNFLYRVIAKGICEPADTSQAVKLTVWAKPNVSISGPTEICKGASATLVASGAPFYSWNTFSTLNQITVSPQSASVTYSVKGTSGNNCSTTVSHTVTPVNPPVITISGSTTSCSSTPLVLTASGASTYVWSSGGTNAIETIISPSMKTYTVTGTNAIGCEGTAVHTVNFLPNIIISGPSAICQGTSATLIASGGVSYSWEAESTAATIEVHPDIKTSYNVTVTDKNGCVNTAGKEVDVLPSPVLTIIADTKNICLGNSVRLEAGTADFYNWSSTDPDFFKWTPGSYYNPILNISPKVTSSYTITGTNYNNCSSNATVTIVVTDCNITPTDITDENKFFRNVYPNPTSGKFIIETQLNEQIIITDVTGNMVKKIISSGMDAIDITDMNNGMYYIAILNLEGNSTVIKLIKQ